jgi:hypothetical protein
MCEKVGCLVGGCRLPQKTNGLCNTHYGQYRRASRVKKISVKDWLAIPKDPISSRKRSSDICSIDGCGSDYKAKGLCDTHYMQYLRYTKETPISISEWIAMDKTPIVSICLFDGCDTVTAAKGLCVNHYYQYRGENHKKALSVNDWLEKDRTLKINRCTVQGCDEISVAKGLCNTHYKRNIRHGHLESTRSKDWGDRQRHPLYRDWCELVRRHGKVLCTEWRDFWVFVDDIGVKPEPGCWFSLIDNKKPVGPDNFYWEKFDLFTQDKVTADEIESDLEDLRSKYTKTRRNTILLNNYGITVNEWEAMYKKQGGVCKICGKKEKGLYSKTGIPKTLSVDHCHDTGKVRGLLCRNCNTGIGNLRHNVDLMQKAIDYCRTT